jgi:hypothetical protein
LSDTVVRGSTIVAGANTAHQSSTLGEPGVTPHCSPSLRADPPLLSSDVTNADRLDQQVGGEMRILKDLEEVTLPAGHNMDRLLEHEALPIAPHKEDTKIDGDVRLFEHTRLRGWSSLASLKNGGARNTEASLPASPLLDHQVGGEISITVDSEPTAVPADSVGSNLTSAVAADLDVDGSDHQVGGELSITVDSEPIAVPADSVGSNLTSAVPAVVVGSKLSSSEKPPINPPGPSTNGISQDMKKVASRSKRAARGTTKSKSKASGESSMVTGKCPSPENHSWFREGPYTKEINGNYSSINGARCLGLKCQRQVVGIAQPGCEREGSLILPSKDFPVWVCCSCDSVLWCDTCFQGKAAAFNKINPGKLPRTRRQKIIGT